MGDEFGQTSEWSLEKGPDWWLTELHFHKGVQLLIQDLNAYYKNTPAIYEKTIFS